MQDWAPHHPVGMLAQRENRRAPGGAARRQPGTFPAGAGAVSPILAPVFPAMCMAAFGLNHQMWRSRRPTNCKPSLSLTRINIRGRSLPLNAFRAREAVLHVRDRYRVWGPLHPMLRQFRKARPVVSRSVLSGRRMDHVP